MYLPYMYSHAHTTCGWQDGMCTISRISDIVNEYDYTIIRELSGGHCCSIFVVCNDHIEDMVTFTIMTKIYSIKVKISIIS